MTYPFIKSTLKGNLPSEDEVLEIYGKIMVNAFFIVNDVIEHIGYGLYLGASILDHSCAPNAHWHFRGKEVIIRTTEYVSDFSDLRISYLKNLTETTQQRQEKLLQNYHFLCDCSTCKDEIKDQTKSSLLCPNCKLGCVPLVIGKCMDCNFSIDSSMTEKYEEIQNQLRKVEEEYSFEEMFHQAVALLHPYDNSYMEFLNLYSAKDEEYQTKNLSNCLEISKIKLRHLYRHLPAFEMHIGKEEIQAAKFCCLLDFLDEAEEHINKARNIFEANFGEDHPILCEELKPISLLIDERRQNKKSNC